MKNIFNFLFGKGCSGRVPMPSPAPPCPPPRKLNEKVWEVNINLSSCVTREIAMKISDSYNSNPDKWGFSLENLLAAGFPIKEISEGLQRFEIDLEADKNFYFSS